LFVSLPFASLHQNCSSIESQALKENGELIASWNLVAKKGIAALPEV